MLSLILLHPDIAHAEDKLSLGVFPPIIEVSALPPASIETQIKLTNKSELPQNIKIILKPFKSSPINNGQVEYLPDDSPPGPDPLLFEKIEFFDGDNPVKKIQLSPIEEKTIKMKIELDDSSQNGDYYFSAIFISEGESPDNTSGSKLTSGVATNILLTIGSTIPAKGTIDEFSTSFFKEKGPVALTLLVKNKSGNYIKPQGYITITNMFGHTVGRLELLPQNILAGSSRYLKAKNQIGSQDSLKNILTQQNTKNDFVIWPETFILGLYTAKATILLSESGPTITRSTTFVSLPLLWVSIFSIISLVGIGIALKVVKKV